MVVGGGVEPWLELHLLVAHAGSVHVGVDGVGLPAHVAQELEVDLVVVVAQRRRLQAHGNGKGKRAKIQDDALDCMHYIFGYVVGFRVEFSSSSTPIHLNICGLM